MSTSLFQPTLRHVEHLTIKIYNIIIIQTLIYWIKKPRKPPKALSLQIFKTLRPDRSKICNLKIYKLYNSGLSISQLNERKTQLIVFIGEDLFRAKVNSLAQAGGQTDGHQCKNNVYHRRDPSLERGGMIKMSSVTLSILYRKCRYSTNCPNDSPV